MLLTQALSSCLVTHTRVHIWKSNWQSEKSVGILKCSESERGDLADHPKKSPCTKQFQYEQFRFVYWKITSFWKFAGRLVVLSPQRPYLVWDMQAFPHGRHAELICFWAPWSKSEQTKQPSAESCVCHHGIGDTLYVCQLCLYHISPFSFLKEEGKRYTII